MTDQSRRQFLQTSAATVGAAGLVSTVGLGTVSAQQTGELPAYAEFVPTGDEFLSQRGELELGTYRLDAQVDLFGQVSTAESIPLQFEPFVYSTLLLQYWEFFGGTNLAEPVFGSLSDFTALDDISEVDSSNIPAERHVLIGRATSLYLGPFDLDTIQQRVDESDATETSQSGLYEYPNGAIVTWGDGYLLIGANVDQVAAIQQTGDGPDQPRYEQSSELETLLRAVDHGGHTLTRLTSDGTLSVGEYGQGLDHSPLEGTSGYIGTLSYDSEATEFSATTVARYPDQSSVATDRISGLIERELDSNVTTDGRSVRLTASYDRAEAGLAPDENSDDGTDDGDDNQDDGSQDDTDGSDGATNETDDGTDQSTGDGSESSDDGGPGFGIGTALSSLGGASYLLARRFGSEDEE
ncbi:twin-arginine translocation signal domain-containing protein [Halovenus halobia]|uniref:twin-arginine translocation signal domain-containing protein n=1 Tax=Halovenus halobia TaxID=3396622 RepID=UPI003F560D68